MPPPFAKPIIIRDAGIPYEIPGLDLLNERLEAVQAVIYLIFNEVYSATGGESFVRKDLCREAIRLARLLCELLPIEPENIGLLALMLLQDSRRDTRMNSNGELVTLEEQDRSRWDRCEINEGLRLAEQALTMGRVGSYQIQAAIAAVHSEAKTADETDWRQIVRLYRELMRFNSSPVVALNHAAAVAMSDGVLEGLALIDEANADAKLENYYLFHASRAELLRRLNRFDEATTAYTRALSLTANNIEKEYLRKRLSQVTQTNGGLNLE